MAEAIARFAPGVDELVGALPGLLDDDARSEAARVAQALVAAGVPATLAERVAASEPVFAALDIAEVAGETGRSRETVAVVHFALGRRFAFAWLRGRIGQLPTETHWQALAKSALRDQLAGLHRALTGQVFAQGGDAPSPDRLLAHWLEVNQAAVGRADRLLAELKESPGADLAMLSVTIAELRALA
jgi:glutamate dehydrogenase